MPCGDAQTNAQSLDSTLKARRSMAHIQDYIARLEDGYRAATPRSRELFERSLVHMPGGAKGAYYYKPYPLAMERGEGCHLHDVDGRSYVDFTNHHTSLIVGHRHPAVLAAVDKQMQKGITLSAPVGIESENAAEICSRVPSVEKLRFCNSGTEATLHAIRLARGLTDRPKIAKFEGGYHGSHDTVEISVAPPLDRAGPADAPIAVPQVKGISPRALEEIVLLPYGDEAAVEKLVVENREELACVMYDPKAGIMPQKPAFAQFLRRITEENDILLIFDEIVGFSTGRSGLHGRLGIKPDLSTYGKIVGGGFPVGAFGGRADIMELLDGTKAPSGFFQSGSFSAHPLGMAAGLATLQQLTTEAFAHLENLSERLCNGLNGLFEEDAFEAQAVHNGAVFSIHFTKDELINYRSIAAADKTMSYPIFLSLLEEGYLLSYGMAMNSISLPTRERDIDGLIAAFGRLIRNMKGASR